MNNNVGELISYNRNKVKMSQSELAKKMFCSRQNISHLENGKRQLKNEYIFPLSNILKFNFKQYVSNSYKFQNLQHYLIAQDLIDAVNSFDYDKIEKLHNDDILSNEFNYGCALVLRDYTKAVYINKKYNDYAYAEQLILNLLQVENRNDLLNFTPTFHDEERYYSSIVLLSNILQKQNEIELASTVIKNTLDFIELYYINDNIPSQSVDIFFRKLHIALLNNYSHLLFEQNNFEEALIYINTAYDMIIKYDILYSLDFILQLKVEILYKLNRIEESQDTYNDFKYACKIKNKHDYFNTVSQSFSEIYPLIKLEQITHF